MDNDYSHRAKEQWKNGGWAERAELWGKVEPMMRAQLILIREEGPINEEGAKFYKSIMESRDETYFTMGGAALALGASRSKETIFYLASKMDKESENADGSEYVRGMCAQAIGRNAEFIEGFEDNEREALLSALRRMLGDESPVVVENAVFALGQMLDYESEGAIYLTTISKLWDEHPASGERKIRWETLALAYCEMGCTGPTALVAYLHVLEECPDEKVAGRVAETVEDLVANSDVDGKARLAKALDVYKRKSALSRMAMESGPYRVDSVIGAVFEKPAFGAEKKREELRTSRLRLKSG